MIILDTNVLSELMRAQPATQVTRWLSTLAPSSLFTTSITQAEILHGILLLPAGRKRDAIRTAAGEMFDQDFAGRILAFGGEAAPAYARIATDRRRAGRPISQFDAQIAAIAASERARLATRNVEDFAGCGIIVVNPWTPDQ